MCVPVPRAIIHAQHTNTHLVGDSCVLGENGDTTLALDCVAVHDPELCFLVVREHVRLLEHSVHQCGLAVINMGNDGDVPDVCARLEGHVIKLRCVGRWRFRLCLWCI